MTGEDEQETTARGDHAGPCRYEARFLVGPTAVGKTAVAHALAERHGWTLLSADAMLVYRGMDIGTAKPSPEERRRYAYGGLDLLEPGEQASLHGYVVAARRFFAEAAREGREVLVVGGSGLYIKALIQGLDEAPGSDAAWRAEAEAVLAARGLEALQALVRARVPEAYAALEDPANPRRLIRAAERATEREGGTWVQQEARPVAGLDAPRAFLHARIAARARRMLDDGLVEETRRLLAAGPLSATAAQAIGYREAAEVLEGRVMLDGAVERIALRTRQLAKRQMTWFRRQARVEWIATDETSNAGHLADAAETVWNTYGKTTVHFK